MSARVTLAVGAVGVVWVALMLSGKGVLVSQDMTTPGKPYFVEGWGDLGKDRAPSLVCTYFVGTRLRKQVFWYSPEGIFGKADCPVLVDR